MSEERKKPDVAFYLTVGLVMLLATTFVYAALYLHMVDHEHAFYTARGSFERPARYTWGGRDCDQEFWEKLFDPAHRLDKQIRRDKWIVE